MFNRRNIGIATGMALAVGLTAGALIASTSEAVADATIGADAPGFTALTSDGTELSLSDFAGKTVVLEWTNDGCPFVQKHYDESHRNMQTLQTGALEDDVVWLSVISSAPGKQGHVSADEANALSEARGAVPRAVLLDESGDIGRLYGAKTTPHMYVITADGALAYQGAIDSNRSANPADIPAATNYVTAALESVATGTPVETTVTKAYGCSVKY